MRFSSSFILSVLLHVALLLAVIFWPRGLMPSVDLKIDPESPPLVGWLTLDNPGGKTGSKPGVPRIPDGGRKNERPRDSAKPATAPEPAGDRTPPAEIPAASPPEPPAAQPEPPAVPEAPKTPEPQAETPKVPEPAPQPEPAQAPAEPPRSEPAPEPKKEVPAKAETVPENTTPISPNKAEEAKAPEPEKEKPEKEKKEEDKPKKDKPADDSKKSEAGTKDKDAPQKEAPKKDKADAGKTDAADKTKADAKKNNAKGKGDPLKDALADARRDVARRESARGRAAVNDALRSMRTDAVVMDALRDLGEGEGGGEGNGMGGGVGDGGGVQVSYQTLVSGIIRNYWTYPNQGDRSIPLAVAYVQISPAGEVVDYRIVQSSGRPDFDSSVLAAIRKANHHPLPPPPSGKAEEFTIRFYNAERR